MMRRKKRAPGDLAPQEKRLHPRQHGASTVQTAAEAQTAALAHLAAKQLRAQLAAQQSDAVVGLSLGNNGFTVLVFGGDDKLSLPATVDVDDDVGNAAAFPVARRGAPQPLSPATPNRRSK